MHESLNLIRLMIPPCNFCLCSVPKTCHLMKSRGDVKPRFRGLRKSGKRNLLWGDPTGVSRLVEIPVFASLCEEPGERTCPSRNGTCAQALPSCAAHSAVVALMLLSKTRAGSRVPNQDEWFYKQTHSLK